MCEFRDCKITSIFFFFFLGGGEAIVNFFHNLVTVISGVDSWGSGGICGNFRTSSPKFRSLNKFSDSICCCSSLVWVFPLGSEASHCTRFACSQRIYCKVILYVICILNTLYKIKTLCKLLCMQKIPIGYFQYNTTIIYIHINITYIHTNIEVLF